MTDKEFSHIEIIQEEEIVPEPKEKNVLLKKLTDLEGWKKDLKKIRLMLGAVAVVFAAYWGLRIVLTNPFSLRLHSPIEFVSFQKYSNPNQNFSFSFPEDYVYDEDEKNKFGDDYLAGFYLDSDQRTGCDVRSSEVGINFAKSDEQINEAIYNDLSQHVKGLNDFDGKRIKIDGSDAMLIEFSLIDPLGNTLQISQVMTTHTDQNYLLACGSGKAQAKYFQNDFKDFRESFRWKK